jgi:osmotically-inducible protein OsmY
VREDQRIFVNTATRNLLLSLPLLATAACAISHSGAASKVSDSAVSQKVRDRLYSESYFKPDRVHVWTENGVVTLSGYVDSIRARNRAVLLVDEIPGVELLVTQLKINSASQTSAELLHDVAERLRLDSTLNSSAVTVTLNEGVVTLKGNVPFEADKMLIGEAVSSVRGVKMVENDIVAQRMVMRTAAHLGEQIRTRISLDPLLSLDDLHVQVQDGSVRIVGSVGSIAEKEAGIEDATVDGIKYIDSSASGSEHSIRIKKAWKQPVIEDFRPRKSSQEVPSPWPVVPYFHKSSRLFRDQNLNLSSPTTMPIKA